MKFFVKFPGRDLGGIFSFLQGFRFDTWIGFILLILVLPLFLYLTFIILNHFDHDMLGDWSLLDNYLLYLAAIAQQVDEVVFTCKISVSREVNKLQG